MSEGQTTKKEKISADWLVRGILTKLGDTFDRFTGRGWKPSSSLATSELSEKLKALVDAEARPGEGGRKFVPHNITLKMQWDKFSTDAEASLKKLETELLTALVDHINDRRLFTHAPISLVVKPDYFTTGVKLTAGFDSLLKDGPERTIDVAVPASKTVGDPAESRTDQNTPGIVLTVCYSLNGSLLKKRFDLASGDRVSIGRTKENDIWIDDASVSKSHASLALTATGLVVADTGSTNGTFVDDARISYGKAIAVTPVQRLKFGSVNVMLEVEELPRPDPGSGEIEAPDNDDSASYMVGEFEFNQRKAPAAELDAATLPGVPKLSGTGSVVLTPITPETIDPHVNRDNES